MLRASVILLLGSLAAPVIYVAIGFFSPAGFHDLRGSPISTTALVLLVSWLFSFLPTYIVGAIAWWPLHARRVDGFASYAAVALVAYAVVYGVSSAGEFGPGPLLLGIGLALSNAILVRLLELSRPSQGARSNSTPHADARASAVLDQTPSARAGGRER